MCAKKRVGWALLAGVVGILAMCGSGFAFEINERLHVGGVLAGVYQHQAIHRAQDGSSLGSGMLVFEPEVALDLSDRDRFFLKLGFGAGNGLMQPGRSPFVLAPWGASTEDDYKNINGRNLDYLLTAWYKHTFRFSEDHTLGITGGIIDAADYLDDNAFANDEFTQFMNEALVNGPNVFVPSYDVGAAVEWDLRGLSVRGVFMALGSNGWEGDLEESYEAYLLQVGYTLDFGLGEGNYRVLTGVSSRSFPNPAETGMERRVCVLASLDQSLGSVFGIWARLGWHDDRAAVDHRSIFSGGLNLTGGLWGRHQDNIGIGYAHLRGGNVEVAHTDVFELYARFALNEFVAVTGDVQYMRDAMKEEESPSGWIFGVRLVAAF